MGKSSGGSAPKPPDPVKTAQMQAQLNRQAAYDSARLNQVNQYNPFARTTWSGAIGSPDRTQHVAYNPILSRIMFGAGGGGGWDEAPASQGLAEAMASGQGAAFGGASDPATQKKPAGQHLGGASAEDSGLGAVGGFSMGPRGAIGGPPGSDTDASNFGIDRTGYSRGHIGKMADDIGALFGFPSDATLGAQAAVDQGYATPADDWGGQAALDSWGGVGPANAGEEGAFGLGLGWGGGPDGGGNDGSDAGDVSSSMGDPDGFGFGDAGDWGGMDGGDFGGGPDGGGDGGGDGGDSGGCFLTSAATQMGETDDGPTLSKLRGFRDSYMQETPARRQLVDHYYSVAPMITKSIPKGSKEWGNIGMQTRQAASMIDKGDKEGALKAYSNMMEGLSDKYLRGNGGGGPAPVYEASGLARALTGAM